MHVEPWEVSCATMSKVWRQELQELTAQVLSTRQCEVLLALESALTRTQDAKCNKVSNKQATSKQEQEATSKQSATKHARSNMRRARRACRSLLQVLCVERRRLARRHSSYLLGEFYGLHQPRQSVSQPPGLPQDRELCDTTRLEGLPIRFGPLEKRL